MKRLRPLLFARMGNHACMYFRRTRCLPSVWGSIGQSVVLGGMGRLSYGVRILLPEPAVQNRFVSGPLGSTTAQLLQEEWHSGLGGLVAQLPRPVKLHRPRARPTLSASYDPGQRPIVEPRAQVKFSEERFSGDEPNVGWYTAENSKARRILLVFDRGPDPYARGPTCSEGAATLLATKQLHLPGLLVSTWKVWPLSLPASSITAKVSDMKSNGTAGWKRSAMLLTKTRRGFFHLRGNVRRCWKICTTSGDLSYPGTFIPKAWGRG